MKFAYKYRQSIAFALYVTLLMSTVAPMAMARPQGNSSAGSSTVSRVARSAAAQTVSAQDRTNATRPQTRRAGRLIDATIPVRSTKGVKGFPSTSRLQIGGAFGSNIQEQVVDITNFGSGTEISDERHPFWSSDEQFVYFSSNRGGGNYQLFRVTPNASPNPATSGTDAIALTNEAGAIHDFPALNATGNRIAYIKSLDNGGTYHLYQALVPASGQSIAAQPTSASLSFNRTFGGETITSVGRPGWLSGTEIVFSATFNSGTKDIMVVDIQSRLLRRLSTGPAAEENVAVSPDGNFVAFDSDATSYNGNASGVVGSTRNIFVVNTAGTEVRQITNVGDSDPSTPPVAPDDVSSVQPAWSRSNVVPIFGTQAQYYIAFASNRSRISPADPARPAYSATPTRDIFYVSAISVDSTTQVRTVTPEVDAAETRDLDTRDTNSQWDDQYPSFPPLINLQRLAFQSNRKGSSATTFVPHNPANQNDLFIASLIDITAPTLLRYDLTRDTGEIVHINLGRTFNAGGTVRNRNDGITPGSDVFFTVRAEDLEAGVQSVYLQFKNPNSKYQAAAQGGTPTEHKEYFAQIGGQTILDGAFTVTEVFQGGEFPLWLQPRNNPRTDRGVNPNNLGVEFECEVVSAAQVLTTGASSYFQHRTNRSIRQSAIGLPGGLYLPSVDDLTAFSGTANPPPLDPNVADDPAIDNDNGIWLKLERLPQSEQDSNGGILYGATWTAPRDDASDWYIDVVLYDRAINPFSPSNQSNWIIYDNVWGFSTAQGLNSDTVDLLFVSDYALGQKFQFTRFGDPNASAGTNNQVRDNLPLIQFGAESYYTDRDLSDALDGVLAIDPPGTAADATSRREFDTFGAFFGGSTVAGSPFGTSRLLIHNALGYGSYTDTFLNPDSTSVTETKVSGGSPATVTGIRPSVGRYSIWRILSRGAVPANVLTDYLPAPGIRPPDTRNNPATNAPYETTAQNIQVVNRAIIWASPFAATSFRGAGAIADLQTQTDLSSYVQNGGRLFVSGQDVAFALGNGSSFLAQVLGATLIDSGTGGQRTLTAAATVDRTRKIATDPFAPSPQRHAYMTTTDRVTFTVSPPSDGVEFTFFDGIISTNSRGDTSLTSLGSAGSIGSNGFLDRIATAGTAQVVFNYGAGGTPAMIYNQFGSGEAVFAAFGFESLTDQWRTYVPTGTDQPTIISNNARRAEIMHNITDSFRTGSISGRILDDNGSPVSDVVVYATPDPGTFATQRASGSALTDANGNYIIQGLAPGFYIVIAERAGFYRQTNVGAALHGGSRASVNLSLNRANPGRLASAQYPANFAGKPNRPRIAGTERPQGGVFRTDDRTGIGGVPILAFRTETSATGIRRVGFLARTSTGDANNPINVNASGRLLQVGEYEFATQLPIGGYTVICNPRALTSDGAELRPDGSNAPVEVRDATGTSVGTDSLAPVRAFATVIVTQPPQAEVDLGVDDPATPTINEATIVLNGQVQIEEDRTAGIDFRLRAAPQPIRGRVLRENADGSAPTVGVPNITVRATSGATTAETTTNANGEFSFVDAAGTPTLFTEGTYVVSVVTANGFDLVAEPTGRSRRPSVTILVGGDSATAIVIDEPRNEAQPLIMPGALIIEQLPPGSVSGLVTRIPGNVATEGANVRLYVADAAGNRSDSDGDASNGITPRYTQVTGPVQTAADGYRFNFRFDPVETGTYVADVELRGFSPSPVISAVITVTSGNETRNVNFSLESPKIYGRGVQLISIPIDYSATAAQGNPRLIFGLDTADTVFNIAEWAGGPDYNVGPNIPLVRGKGYFVRFGDTTAVTNSQGVAPSGNELQITLLPGWNLIGHPFARIDNPYALPGDIELASGTRFTGPDGVDSTFDEAVAKGYIRGIAYGYTGELSNSQYFQSSVLKPYLGYWFRNTSTQTVQMRFLRPSEAASAATRSVKGRKPGAAVTRAEQEKIRFRSIDSKSTIDWSLQLAVRQGDLLDTDNSVGVKPGAKDGFDTQYDTEKPPVMNNVPMVYLSVEGKNATGGRAVLADDIRDGSQVGVAKRTWDFNVRPAEGKGDVTVFWPNVNRLPRGIEPFLVDVATGKRIPLRSASSYKYTPSSEEMGGRAVHRFQIEVAKPSSIPLMLTNVRQSRVDGRGVGQSGYRIAFKVTRESDVTAEIQTLTGRTVNRLATRGRSIGESVLFWNGRSQQGMELPAGAYMLTLTAKDSDGSVVQVRQPIISLR